MDFRILGPLEVGDGDAVPSLGGAKQRALLAVLLLSANQVVSTDRLIEDLWAGRAPQSGRAALQVRISQLRKALGAAGAQLVTRPPGYVLQIDPEQIDSHRFERLLAAADGAPPELAAVTLREALSLWRGPALADLAYESFAQGAVRRLEELRVAALEKRIWADLALGRHSDLVGELETLVAEHPLQERLQGQLMLALYRSGRQVDALSAYRGFSERLRDQLGLDPGSALLELERQILTHDPVLARATHAGAAPVADPRRHADGAVAARSHDVTRLFEREADLARAVRLLDEARGGSGSVMVVEGPAGIGKSELLAAVRTRAAMRGLAVLAAKGSEFEADMPLGVARQLFEPLLRGAGGRERRQLLAGAARVGGRALGLEAGEALVDRFAATHGLYWLCANAAEKRALAIVVDDVQWADDASLRWLGYLSRRVPELPVLLAVALRIGDPGGERVELARMVGGGGVQRFALGPLSQAAIGAIVRSQLDSMADEPFCNACGELSGGNPLFVRELLAAARTERVPARIAGIPALRSIAPAAVTTSVLGRLARLGDEATALARAAAVLDTDAEVATAAALAGIDPVVAELAADRLAAVQIFASVRPLEFSHPLIAAAVREDTGAGARRVAHRRAAELLYRGGQVSPARVSAHLLSCGPGSDGWVVNVLRAAAQEASASGLPEAALSYLERGLKEAASPAVRAELLFELGVTEQVAGRAGATQRLREALELTIDRRRRAEISLALGRALITAGDAAARESFKRGLAELSDGEDELSLELQGWNMTSSYAHDERALSTVVRARLDALLADETQAITRPERFLLAHVAFRSALSGERPYDQVAQLASRALADGELLEDSQGDVATHGVACYALLYASEPTIAIGECNRAIAWGQRRGARAALGRFSLLIGIGRYARGEIIDALEDLVSAGEAQEVGFTRDFPAMRAFRALCLIERDDLVGAGEALAVSAADEPKLAEGHRISYLYATARLRSAHGDFPEALGTLLECDELVREVSAPNPAATLSWRSEAAVLAARLGKRDQAEALIGEELELARAFGAPHALGIALRAAGTIAGGHRGQELLAQAVETLEGSGIQLELARSLAEQGAALRRAGRRIEARAQLVRALDLAHGLGARRIANYARTELIAAGARPRRDATLGREALTASEFRVARLAAQGLTNREVAQALFITSATTKTHLSRVYRKLAITRRDQLADALGRPVGDAGADATARSIS